MLIDRVYYRATSTYPSSPNLSSGWSKIPAASSALSGVIIEDKAKATEDKGSTRVKGNGNTYTETLKNDCSFTLFKVAAADYAALRSAFINVDVDIILVDSNAPTIGYLTHNICVHPKGTLESGKTYTVEVTGENQRDVSNSNPSHQQITVSGVS